jgi:hypothetical protein
VKFSLDGLRSTVTCGSCLTPEGTMNRAPTEFYAEIAEGTEKEDGHGVPCPYEAIHHEESFDDDAEEFLFSGTEEKFARIGKVNVFAWIVDTSAIDFYAALLDETRGLAFRWR